jgi:hypothetical protein
LKEKLLSQPASNKKQNSAKKVEESEGDPFGFCSSDEEGDKVMEMVTPNK